MKQELLNSTALPERPKAVIYCRVSTLQQTKRGDGLGSQEATCRQYAERMGYDVVEVFRDAVTGSVTDRPAMDELLRYVRKHKSKGLRIIVDSGSRFSRDVRGHWELRDLLTAAGGKLESPNMKFGDSPADHLVENVITAASQYQKEDNAAQTHRRMEGRLLNGFWPFIPPRGMVNQVMPGTGKILVRLEPEASVIAEGLEGFASGRIASQAEFARWLNAHPKFSKGKSKGITNQQAYVLLTNFLYAGVVERPEWGVSRRKAQHKGLISYETWEKIQARLKGAAYTPARTDVSADFPLRGSVQCAECGNALTACWSKSRQERSTLTTCVLAERVHAAESRSGVTASRASFSPFLISCHQSQSF